MLTYKIVFFSEILFKSFYIRIRTCNCLFKLKLKQIIIILQGYISHCFVAIFQICLIIVL